MQRSLGFSLTAGPVSEEKKETKELILSDPRLSHRIHRATGNWQQVSEGSRSAGAGAEKKRLAAPTLHPRPPAPGPPDGATGRGAQGQGRKEPTALPTFLVNITDFSTVKDRQTDTGT